MTDRLRLPGRGDRQPPALRCDRLRRRRCCRRGRRSFVVGFAGAAGRRLGTARSRCLFRSPDHDTRQHHRTVVRQPERVPIRLRRQRVRGSDVPAQQAEFSAADEAYDPVRFDGGADRRTGRPAPGFGRAGWAQREARQRCVHGVDQAHGAMIIPPDPDPPSLTGDSRPSPMRPASRRWHSCPRGPHAVRAIPCPALESPA